jgi:hypothetical protein
MEEWVWITIIGLAADITGAWILAAGLFISTEEAVRLSVTKVAGDTVEENLVLPAVQDRLRQSSRAKLGVLFLVLGFLLQAIGSLVSPS